MSDQRETLHEIVHEYGGLHNIINGYLALLRAEALGPVSAEQREAYDAIEQKTRQVHEFIQERIQTFEQSEDGSTHE